MKILVSACLTGRPCRYDGSDCSDPGLRGVLGDGEVVPVCPEVLGGLSIPRGRAEIVGGDGRDVLGGEARVMTAGGEDVTAAFISGARECVRVGQAHKIDRVIVKSRSPSCGLNGIFDGTFSGRMRPGAGVAAAAFEAADFQVVEIDGGLR